ncbi:MAG TPA: DUF1704 domain-containing protein [Polyangiaceae bacterium LLY-WYZ-15_(1-7)]|nr:DUF1704 domain-containing protein [Polyangiaceae bacterium LLY-WYZ-15_(1-7)]
MPDRREALRELSELLTEAARDVKVLSALSWPEHVVEAFLQRWRAGDRSLPTPPEPKARPDHVRERLEEVLERADWSDPVGQLLADTADSYLRILELLDYAGTPEAHRLSREIYGGPEARIPGSRLTNLEAADRLLEYTSALAAATPDEEAEYCVAPMEVASALRSRWDGFFETPIEIVVDPDLASKAAASASRVRLRASADFSANDVRQLAEHEIGVHSLTSRNGRGQPVLPSLGLGAPRTTATQEGLATFAELVTGAIDLARLRRLAYRVRAIHLAEQGANFLQVFEWLLSIGEPPGEAARTSVGGSVAPWRASSCCPGQAFEPPSGP